MADKAVTDFSIATDPVAQANQLYLLQGTSPGSDRRVTVEQLLKGAFETNAAAYTDQLRQGIMARTLDRLLIVQEQDSSSEIPIPSVPARAAALAKIHMKDLFESFGSAMVVFADAGLGVINLYPTAYDQADSLQYGESKEQWFGDLIVIIPDASGPANYTFNGTVSDGIRIRFIHMGDGVYPAEGRVPAYDLVTLPSGNYKVYAHHIHDLALAVDDASTITSNAVTYANATRARSIGTLTVSCVLPGEAPASGTWFTTSVTGSPTLGTQGICIPENCRVGRITGAIRLANALPAGESITVLPKFGYDLLQNGVWVYSATPEDPITLDGASGRKTLSFSFDVKSEYATRNAGDLVNVWLSVNSKVGGTTLAPAIAILQLQLYEVN